jgi:4,5-DOPA dioxygenase extradiol
MADLMPSIFIGHGNPMNALQQNAYTEGWRKVGQSIPRPEAIVCVSAHWYRPGVAVTVSTSPKTIHDFGGFPRPLYEVQYPAPGNPELAEQLKSLMAPLPVELDERWGLDHGTWSVLCHLYPNADVPVVQLSIDETQSASFHFDIGKRLAPLREQGVLIVGSGNLVHNLHTYAWGKHVIEPYPWAQEFERRARDLILGDEPQALVDYERLGREALLSVPTPEHYLPLLYVLGSRSRRDRVEFPVEGIEGGSISMLAVQLAS